jgi:biotin carboxylase
MTFVALEWLTFGLGRLVSAAESRGCDLVLLTSDASVYHRELSVLRHPGPLTVVKLDTSNADRVQKYLSSLTELDGLMNSTDTWSLMSVELRSQRGLPGPAPASVRLARDKASLRIRLHEAGLSRSPAMRFDQATISTEALRAVRTPFIAKDSAGTGSRNVWVAFTRDDIPRIVGQLRTARLAGDISVEPYFRGPLYSAETLTWQGKTRLLGVTSRLLGKPPSFREDGVAFPCQLQPAEVAAWITRVLDAIGYVDGFAHSEFIATQDGFEIVEVNPRLGGMRIGEMMCRSLGANIYDAFFDLAAGRRPSLMDLPLTISQAWAEVGVYAPTLGSFVKITGLDAARQYPGDPDIAVLRRPGTPVTDTQNDRALMGSVLTSGPTTEIAMHNALAASGELAVEMGMP